MDSSPSVQAGSGDGSGKPMLDMVKNQAAGEWVPSSPVGMPNLVKEALPTRASRPPIKVLTSLQKGHTLAFEEQLLELHRQDVADEVGYLDDGTAMPVVRKKVVHGIGQTRTAPLEEHLGLPLNREEQSSSFPVLVRVQLSPILRRSNAEFMFSDADFYAEKNGHLYYKYASLTTAQAACHRVNKGNTFNIEVGVDAILDTPDKETARNEDLARPKKRRHEANELSAESGERKPTEADAKETEEGTEMSATVAADQMMKGEMSIRMDTSLFNWRPITQFCSIEGNGCATRFKFNVAEIFGSVCNSVTMSTCSDIGNMIFPSLVGYMFKAFEQKLSWGGKIRPEDLVINENGACAIVAVPLEKATPSNIVMDLSKVVHDLKELYMVDGILPPYYEDLFSFVNDIPDGIADETEILKQVMLQLVNHTCFLPDEKKWGLLQEFYVFFKNLEEAAKENFNQDTAEMSNSGWQDIPESDCLLSAVKKASRTFQDTLADESSYLRHLGVHIMDQVFQIWLSVQKMTQAYDASSKSELEGEPEPLPRFVLKERMMLIAYYFGDFFPKFFRFLFRAMNTHPWIEELCSPFLRKKFEIAAAPFGSVYLASKGLAEAKNGK